MSLKSYQSTILTIILLLAAGSQARSAVPPIGMPSDVQTETVEIKPCEGGEMGYPLPLPVRNRRTGAMEPRLVLFSQPIAEPAYMLCFYVFKMTDGIEHAVHIH